MKTADLVFDRSYINGELVTAGNATLKTKNINLIIEKKLKKL